jgi:hypothetical protein
MGVCSSRGADGNRAGIDGADAGDLHGRREAMIVSLAFVQIWASRVIGENDKKDMNKRNFA